MRNWKRSIEIDQGQIVFHCIPSNGIRMAFGFCPHEYLLRYVSGHCTFSMCNLVLHLISYGNCVCFDVQYFCIVLSFSICFTSINSIPIANCQLETIDCQLTTHHITFSKDNITTVRITIRITA